MTCLASLKGTPTKKMLEFELLAQQADAAGQWGTQTHVCAHVSWVVGVHLFCR